MEKSSSSFGRSSVAAEAEAEAEAEEDKYSPWRFRFWRCVAMASHAALMNLLLQQVDFTVINNIHPMILATITSFALSAVTLVVYYQFVRFMSSSVSDDDGGIGNSTALGHCLVILIHTLACHVFKENPFFPLLFSLQGISFIAYSRSLISGDKSLIILVFLLSYTARALQFYSSTNLQATLYFASVTLVGCLALAIDKGFRAINAGILDLFLGILGDLESPVPRKGVMKKIEESGDAFFGDDNQVPVNILKHPKTKRRIKG